MPLNLIWLEQATHPVVLEASDAAAEPALRRFDLAGSLGHGHAREEWWADKLVVPPLGPQTNSSNCSRSSVRSMRRRQLARVICGSPSLCSTAAPLLQAAGRERCRRAGFAASLRMLNKPDRGDPLTTAQVLWPQTSSRQRLESPDPVSQGVLEEPLMAPQLPLMSH